MVNILDCNNGRPQFEDCANEPPADKAMIVRQNPVRYTINVLETYDRRYPPPGNRNHGHEDQQHFQFMFLYKFSHARSGTVYSHSMVAGCLELMSYTTRLTPRSSLIIRFEILASTSAGMRAQSAVMPSTLVT